MTLGLHHNGMHDWILDELVLGARVAHALDSEATGWTAAHDLSYALYVRHQEERPDACGQHGDSDVGYCRCTEPAGHPLGAHGCPHGPW